MRLPPEYQRQIEQLARERGALPLPLRAPAPTAGPEPREVPQGVRKVSRPAPGVMNKTERAYADHLELRVRIGELKSWRFEALKFRLGPKCFYTPDFLLIFPDGSMRVDEIKGHMRDDAQVKMRWFVERFPEFPLVVVRRAGGGWTFERR